MDIRNYLVLPSDPLYNGYYVLPYLSDWACVPTYSNDKHFTYSHENIDTGRFPHPYENIDTSRFTVISDNFLRVLLCARHNEFIDLSAIKQLYTTCIYKSIYIKTLCDMVSLTNISPEVIEDYINHCKTLPDLNFILIKCTENYANGILRHPNGTPMYFT